MNQRFRVPPFAGSVAASLVEAVLQDVLQDVVGRLHVAERLPRLRDVNQDLRGCTRGRIIETSNNSINLGGLTKL